MNAVFFKKTFFLSLFVLAFFISCHRFSPPASSVSIDRGRYLSVISGCHDCHTPGWAAAGGKAEEKIWLTGSDVGFEGPWGTTYPTNLRLNLQQMTEDQWVNLAHVLHTLPPMPWWILNAMTEDDLRSLYRFIRSLGPAGKPAPAVVPENVVPNTLVIPFVPEKMKK